MAESSQTFSCQCRQLLEPFLKSVGYSYVSTYVRPRGIAVEFAKQDNLLFAVCEGNVFYLDLIYHHSDEGDYRVSLNQALWFNDVKSFVKLKSCQAQLEVFVKETRGREILSNLLSHDCLQIDDRYCYRMTNGRELYLSSQRGNEQDST